MKEENFDGFEDRTKKDLEKKAEKWGNGRNKEE